jgi:methylenetetrahydrofolate dehydrogenase (NADP+)/methenyltetrahydrofolate cyclohydrolase
MPVIMDGKALSLKLGKTVTEKVSYYKEKYSKVPGLAVILVGEDEASKLYVGMKEKRCIETGFKSVLKKLPEDTTTETLLKHIDIYNKDNSIHGILVQLPLPKHIDEKKVLYAIDPKKDVDGFHPYNIGLMYIAEDTFYPCTPYGVMKLFEEYSIDLQGKDVVVIGASNIVGRPMAAMLLKANATVTICHVYTKNLPEICKRADIVISAVGKPKLVDRSYLKQGAVVIDIGMNRDANGKLCGDVDFEDVKDIVSYITPVPGGVGPMTITMLMSNTLKAFEQTL